MKKQAKREWLQTEREGFKLGVGKTNLHCEGGETLVQVAQRSYGCPIPGNVQGHAGWGSEQPGIVEGVTKPSRGVGTV